MEVTEQQIVFSNQSRGLVPSLNALEREMKKSYQGTKVNWAKSQTQIVKLLNGNGIYESRLQNTPKTIEEEMKHKHEYESGIISLGYAMAGKGHIAQCKICHKDFNKNTGELEEPFEFIN